VSDFEEVDMIVFVCKYLLVNVWVVLFVFIYFFD